MKIAFVSEHASPLAVLGGVDAGGQNVHVAALAEVLARQGNEVVVYTRRDDPDLPKAVPFSSGVIVEHIDAGPPERIDKDHLLPHMGEFARQLSKRWQESRPDIVHAHFWMSGKASLDAAMPLEIPVVQTFHALGAEKRRMQGARDTSPPTRLEEEGRIARESTHIVATATAEVFELVRMGADRSNITVVPCGVDLSHFSPLGPSEGRDRRFHRVVSISRLVERKGIGELIAALQYVPDAELVIAGGPSFERLWENAEAVRLREVARSFGIENRVKFRGSLDRTSVPRLLRSADVVVCYPWYEPFGIVPLEAMACGVPVVVAQVGGLMDSVIDGVTGVHVPPLAPPALGRVLRDLLPDERRRLALGLAGVTRTSERYGWPRIASDTYAVYNRIVTERHFAVRAS
jgi:D-inositol-3-phosphate glycosyltransferase